MANYNTQAVLDHPVDLTREQMCLLQLTGAEFESIKTYNAIDQVVIGDLAVGVFHVFWTETFYENLDEALEDFDGCVDDSYREGLSQRWGKLRIEDLLANVLKRNPKIPYLTLRYAYTCSKMRSDGFGGGATIITRKQVVSIDSYAIEQIFDVNEGGDIKQIKSPTITDLEDDIVNEIV